MFHENLSKIYIIFLGRKMLYGFICSVCIDFLFIDGPMDVKFCNFLSSSRAPRIGGSSHEAHSVVPFRNFEEEMKQSGVWEAGTVSSSTADGSRDNLASLYRPPFALMFHGPFENVTAHVFDVIVTNAFFLLPYLVILIEKFCCRPKITQEG